jgi:hypothetical protein
MADPFENKHIDKRVAHRYLRKGIVDDKEYEKHLKNLPDLAERAVPVEASIESEDLAEDEGGEGGPGQG